MRGRAPEVRSRPDFDFPPSGVMRRDQRVRLAVDLGPVSDGVLATWSDEVSQQPQSLWDLCPAVTWLCPVSVPVTVAVRACVCAGVCVCDCGRASVCVRIRNRVSAGAGNRARLRVRVGTSV